MQQLLSFTRPKKFTRKYVDLGGYNPNDPKNFHKPAPQIQSWGWKLFRQVDNIFFLASLVGIAVYLLLPSDDSGKKSAKSMQTEKWENQLKLRDEKRNGTASSGAK
jgi:hypothetical protein